MPRPRTLTREFRETLDRAGVARIPGFYPAADIALMAENLWADLGRRFGMVRDRPDTWTTVRPGQFQQLARAGAFRALGSRSLLHLADDLLGAGEWEPPARWGQPLVTFPSEVWDLRRVMWHLDFPATGPERPPPGLRAFTFLEPVLPHGGGTLYVAGSHRVAMAIGADEARPIPSGMMRERLKAHDPWFADLWAIPGDEVRGLIGQGTRVGETEVWIAEMTGDPGDLVVMHPFVLHGMAHNALHRPRMMLAQGLHRRSA